MPDTPNTVTRKRVRFEEDQETRQVKRRIQEIPLPKSSLLTPGEKTLYWMQPEDHRYTLNDVMALMHDCHHEPKSDSDSDEEDSNRVPFSRYAEALAVTFTLCDTPPVCNDDDEPPLWNIRDSSSVGQLALWASSHTPTRGVESKILPGLHQERQLRRSRAINAVLEGQKQLSAAPLDERIAALGDLSRAFTHSAKQFATALAVVDGTQAYLEYTKDTDDGQKKQEVKPEKTKAASVTPTEEIEDNNNTTTARWQSNMQPAALA